MASCDPARSACTVPMLVTTPICGSAISHRNAISPGHVEAHFQNGPLMPGTESQDRQRQSDLVVQIAGALQSPKTLGKHLRHHLLGGRLAHAASDSDHAQVELAPPESGNVLQSAGRCPRRAGTRAGVRSPTVEGRRAGAQIEVRHCAPTSRCTSAKAAPRSKASARNSCPSTRSPGTATNNAPGITWRKSMAASVMIASAAGRVCGHRFHRVGQGQHHGFAISPRTLSGGMLIRSTSFLATSEKTGAAVSEPQIEVDGLSSQT